MRTVIDDLKAIGEKELETFIYDRLVVSKVPISQKINLNKIEMWNHTDAGQLKCKAEFSSFKSALKKMNSACEHKKLWLNNCLNMKLTISLKACAEIVKMTSNYIMAQKFKLVNGLIHQLL